MSDWQLNCLRRPSSGEFVELLAFFYEIGMWIVMLLVLKLIDFV
jgi:hypothetical protein